MIKVLFIDTIFARLIDFYQLLLDFTLLSKLNLEATKKNLRKRCLTQHQTLMTHFLQRPGDVMFSTRAQRRATRCGQLCSAKRR